MPSEQPVSPRVRIEKTVNLFSPNACLNFEPDASGDDPVALSGISCFAEVPAKGRQFAWQRALGVVGRAVRVCNPSLRPWVCTSELTHGYAAGRWGAKKRLRELSVASGASVSHSTQALTPSGFVQHCAAHQTEHETALVAKSVDELRQSTLLCWLPPEHPPLLDELTKLGWTGDLRDNDVLRQVSITVVRWGGVLLRLFGSFDDREAGVDVVLDPAMWQCVVEECQTWLNPSLFHGA